MDKGAFGQVVRCLDHKLQSEVAIKINRNSTYDHSSSKTEIAILRKLQEGLESKEEQWVNQFKERVVEFKDSFFFRNHFCLVFEILGKNLYSDLKNKQIFELRSHMKDYTHQILQALVYLKKLSIIHCDLKPENVLLKNDEKKEEVKVIDFGSGCFSSEKGFTYVQSRFYRAPEVVLGLPYDQQVDMWSLGCIVAELYSGVPLFPAIDENELIEFFTLLCGDVPKHMIDLGKKKEKFFNVRKDYKMIRSMKSRLFSLSKETTTLTHIIFREKFMQQEAGQEEGYLKVMMSLSSEENLLLDFITKALKVDPKERMTCEEALNHPYFSEIEAKLNNLKYQNYMENPFLTNSEDEEDD
mmetsp:Transcript_22528/g.21684  ORF Transcript_22528/g.21684 Transcript_22528/m.21684 type:complete len:355 (-) Transcript_22528:344-1408(-)